jgi:hypothetical protein
MIHFTGNASVHAPAQRRFRYCDLLRAGRSGDRIPVEVEIFRTRPDRPGAYPASYTMGTGSFPGVNRAGGGVDRPPLI